MSETNKTREELSKELEDLLSEVDKQESLLNSLNKKVMKKRNEITYRTAKEMIDSWPQWKQDYAKEYGAWLTRHRINEDF